MKGNCRQETGDRATETKRAKNRAGERRSQKNSIRRMCLLVAK